MDELPGRDGCSRSPDRLQPVPISPPVHLSIM